MSIDLDRLAGELYMKIRANYDIVADRKVDVGEIMAIIGTVMEIVEAQKGLNGTQKKDLVVEIVGRIVDDLPIDPTKRNVIGALVDYLLPFIIDKIVAASKGELKINERIEGAKTCCSGVWKCLWPGK